MGLQSTVMVSDPIPSCQIKGEMVEAVIDFLFLGSKITADGDHSHEIRQQLLLGRKAMTNLDAVFKGEEHFADNGLYSQGYGFFCSHVWI